jgi:hypothetical protein
MLNKLLTYNLLNEWKKLIRYKLLYHIYIFLKLIKVLCKIKTISILKEQISEIIDFKIQEMRISDNPDSETIIIKRIKIQREIYRYLIGASFKKLNYAYIFKEVNFIIINKISNVLKMIDVGMRMVRKNWDKFKISPIIIEI